MKLTKEDYMKLDKERLAELLVEIENERPSNDRIEFVPTPNSYPLIDNAIPCWVYGGQCINPFYDCVGCSKRWTTRYDWGTITSNGLTVNTNDSSNDRYLSLNQFYE